jgi:hypothetical protein
MAALSTMASPSTSSAQDAPVLPVFSEEVSVQWISVPTVLAATWPPDLALESDHFELWVDDAPVAIEGFDEWQAPFGLLFAQDLSGSMAIGNKLELGSLALHVLGALAEDGDQLAVVTFAGERVDLQVAFTSDEQALRAAPAGWGGYGTTALRDALAALPDFARTTDRPRRAVVLVTDGIDNASSVPIAEVQALLAGEGLPLYVLDVDTDSDERPALEDGRDEGMGLAELAAASGGRRLRVSSPLEAQSAARAIVSDLRHQILLSFTTDSAGEPALRRIEVSLLGTTDGLVHRSRYFGPPPGHVLSVSESANNSLTKKKEKP